MLCFFSFDIVSSGLQIHLFMSWNKFGYRLYWSWWVVVYFYIGIDILDVDLISLAAMKQFMQRLFRLLIFYEIPQIFCCVLW